MALTKWTMVASALAAVLVSGPIDAQSPVPLIFESSWETATGTSAEATLDGGRWDARSDVNTGAVVSTEHVDGRNALESSFPPSADFLPNGPNFRVEKLSSFGEAKPNLYLRWWVKHSPNWVWGNAEHKMVILYAPNAITEQPLYISADHLGRLFFYNRMVDSNFTTTAQFRIGQWDLVEVHVLAGANGRLEARFNGQPVTLTSSPGTHNPLNMNMGTAFTGFKPDSTYNDYQRVINYGQTIRRYTDAFAVSTQGWIGGAGPLPPANLRIIG